MRWGFECRPNSLGDKIPMGEKESGASLIRYEMGILRYFTSPPEPMGQDSGGAKGVQGLVTHFEKVTTHAAIDKLCHGRARLAARSALAQLLSIAVLLGS